MTTSSGTGRWCSTAPGPSETLPGHRRVWGVATDNVRHIPGYKKYLSREDGSRPDIYVAFVDIEPDPGSAVRGLVRPLAEASWRSWTRASETTIEST